MKVKGFVLGLALFLAAVGCGGSGGSSSGAIYVRTVMLVRGATSVTVNGSQSGNLSAILPFPAFTAFGAYSMTSQTFAATDVGVSPNVALGSVAEGTLVPNGFYTLYVTGVEGNATFPTALKFVQETPPTASVTASQIRFCNFSTSLNQSVDVYVTLSSSNTPLSGQTPLFSAVPYGHVSSYTAIPGGTYVVTITPAGNNATVLYTSNATVFNNGLVYTNYASDTTTPSPTLFSEQDSY